MEDAFILLIIIYLYAEFSTYLGKNRQKHLSLKSICTNYMMIMLYPKNFLKLIANPRVCRRLIIILLLIIHYK